MRRSTIQLLLTLAGVLLFNFLFWGEQFGINLLLFTFFYLAALWWIFPEGRRSRGFRVMAGGALLAAAMVVWHGSAAAKFAWWISASCAAGFVQDEQLRYTLYALGQYVWGLWQAPRHVLEGLAENNATGARQSLRLGRQLSLSVVPLLVVMVFYFLYYLANDKFASLADTFWGEVGRFLRFDISFTHVLFVLLGFFLVGAAFWRNQSDFGAEPDQLERRRPPKRTYKIMGPNPMGLRREYRQSILVLWMLNILLLLVNLTDVRYVWFGFDAAARDNLKEYVHEGTYLLIVSILLAMWVLFHVFRKNLNFYPSRQPLQRLALAWMIQNAVLAFSVGIRNWRYIDYHGLAYKRIGVVLFLALVFFGLYTLWQKIHLCRTMHWLWRQNGWAFYALVLLNACVSWDVFITRYNLSGRAKGAVDVSFMVNDLSDKNLFLLEQNIDRLAQIPMYPVVSEDQLREGVLLKRQEFNEKMDRLSWKSWNMGDARNAN